jgi:putative phage-type endonuclease
MTAIVQNSPEWFAQRLGKVTASRIKDVMAKGKTGEAATRATYRAQLVAERLSGKVAEGFTTASMKWGTDCEPLARAAYEAETGNLVTEVAMIEHPTIKMAGASPDGLIGKEGGIEVKCPETKTHIDTILSDKAPSEYVLQMQWQMACAGMKWVDFISFDPRMPSDMQLFVKRVERDEAKIAEIETEVKKFLAEVEQTIEKLNAWKAKK